MLNSIKNMNTKPLYLVDPCQARKAWPRRHCLKTRTCALSIWSQQNLAQETKCFTQSNFVVIGTDRDRKTGALRALLAHNDGSGLNYAEQHSLLLVVRNALGFSVSLSASSAGHG
jgi:hypothetical protein